MTEIPCDICTKKDCYKLSLISGNIFEYAWGGVFIMNDNNLPPNTNLLCGDCMLKYNFEKYKTIECSVCCKKFQNMRYDDDNEDAYDCACTIYEGGISCGYGSNYDGCIIEFYDDKKPTNLKLATNICDTCLGELIKENICIITCHP